MKNQYVEDSEQNEEVDHLLVNPAGATDSYRLFELKLPFAKTSIKTFLANVDKAIEACNNEGSVTIEALAD